MSNAIQTVAIHGKQVLAKTDKYGTHAITYSNRFQASRMATSLRSDGIDCWVTQFSRPFLVVINSILEAQ